MAKRKKFGSVKRFGVRYGRKIKDKIANIERISKKKQDCPYCGVQSAKRVSFGIWFCGKCDSKFSGGAYYLEPMVQRSEGSVKQEERIVLKREMKSSDSGDIE